MTPLTRVALLLAATSCVPRTFEATTGRVYDEGSDPQSSAAIASASRDIPCDRPLVKAVKRERFTLTLNDWVMVPTVLEGCGKRATYKVVHAEPMNDRAERYVLVSVEPIAVGPNTAISDGGAGGGPSPSR
jgi:hypothetical protein